MVDLHTDDSFARTRMTEDAQRAARERLRRHLAVSGRARFVRALAAVADLPAPSRGTPDPAYELERAA